MKSITGNNTKQSGGGDNLTSQQRMLLSHFGSMDGDAQRCFMRMAASIAQGCPRHRPTLRLVAGGSV